jgi:DNA-directed RNA polymerase II subunit RPB1
MTTDVYTYDSSIINIDRIEFGILGNNEIKNMSAIKEEEGISKSESYNNFEPVIGGLVDKRLGITDPYFECSTCGLNSIKCPGHFGHIKLEEPVYHIGYIPFIKKILGCICIKCSKLLVYKNEKEIDEMLKTKTGKARFAEIRNLCKNVNYCQQVNYGCGAPVPKIIVDIKKSTSAINIIAEVIMSTLSKDEQTGKTLDTKKKIKQIITPKMCYNILKNISDIDCQIMGLDPKKSRPEMMIIMNFPVPPVQVRPSIKADFLASATYEDDLTHKLSDIITRNNMIKKYKEKEGIDEKYSVFILDNAYLLQYHIATFFDNDSVSLLRSEQRNGHPIKSISSRLKSKEGRIRGNLMGKRVDFSGRTVIGPDPNLKINELGVPLKIAMNLTFPEIVTPDNIERLTTLVRNGRDKYPGANFVFPISSFTSDKRYILDLRYSKKNIILRFGDVVERHLIDGDTVLFNRQPSLHKLSMMGHKIRIINDINLTTYKLNLAVTPPYNADFDGDEMNMFVPQSTQGQIELDLIANVTRQIISPGTSMPVIGCVQDSVSGAYLFTLKQNSIKWYNMMDLMMYTTITDIKVDKNKMYTGNDIFSKLIPKKINLNVNTDIGRFSIRNGEIIEGTLSKKIIGAKKNSIIHLIWNEYDINKTQEFIDNTQRLINNWLLNNGFTISMGDTVVDKKVINQINTIVDSKKLEINHLITEIENNPNIMDPNDFESNLYDDLNAIGGTINELVYRNLNNDNNFYVAVTSQAKGSKINIGSIIGIVGQQAVEGKRIMKRINNRSLYHFHQNDDSAIARGFCYNSFLDGLTPQEFYFHTMAAREGLIDTAIKTADTGYIQRKLIKALEDVSIKYDGSTRNSNNIIMQFVYGDNNINPACQVEHKLNIVNLNNKQISEKYYMTTDQLKMFKNYTEKHNKNVYNMMIQFRDELRDIQQKARLNYITLQDKFMLPIGLIRIINNIKYANIKNDTNEQLDPLYVLNKINNLLESDDTHIICMTNKDRENKNSLKNKDEQIVKTMLRFALHEYLSPKRCIFEYKMNKMKFDNVINQIKIDYVKAKVNAGEMVGSIAGQSIGEPATQLTLNTFHFTGIASKGTGMLGVPRLRELLSLTKSPKTPVMSIYLQDKYTDDKLMANKIASYLKHTTLNDLTDKLEVYYDPDPFNNSYRDIDNATKDFKVINPTDKTCSNNIKKLPWLFRLILNKNSMLEKNTNLLDIKSKICTFWLKKLSLLTNLRKEERILLSKVNQISVSSNFDNSIIPILHIRVNFNEVTYNIINGFKKMIMEKFKLKGITNINKINDVSHTTVINYDKEGNINKSKQYVIYTDGINVKDIRYINGIDLLKTSISDIITIYNFYGIEAARTVLIKEITTVIEAGGNFANYQHIALLVDLMTNTGGLTSIDRHGINKLDTDPLARASFENTIEQLLTAATFGEVDTMRSVSSRIMVGSVINGGTGLCELMIDNNMFENSEYVEEYEKPLISKFNELTENKLIKDVLNKKEVDIFLPL